MSAVANVKVPSREQCQNLIEQVSRELSPELKLFLSSVNIASPQTTERKNFLKNITIPSVQTQELRDFLNGIDIPSPQTKELKDFLKAIKVPPPENFPSLITRAQALKALLAFLDEANAHPYRLKIYACLKGALLIAIVAATIIGCHFVPILAMPVVALLGLFLYTFLSVYFYTKAYEKVYAAKEMDQQEPHSRGKFFHLIAILGGGIAYPLYHAITQEKQLENAISKEFTSFKEDLKKYGSQEYENEIVRIAKDLWTKYKLLENETDLINQTLPSQMKEDLEAQYEQAWEFLRLTAKWYSHRFSDPNDLPPKKGHLRTPSTVSTDFHSPSVKRVATAYGYSPTNHLIAFYGATAITQYPVRPPSHPNLNGAHR